VVRHATNMRLSWCVTGLTRVLGIIWLIQLLPASFLMYYADSKSWHEATNSLPAYAHLLLRLVLAIRDLVVTLPCPLHLNPSCPKGSWSSLQHFRTLIPESTFHGTRERICAGHV
jgi:hypothetical protein